jgi:hypothetical protein
VIVAELEVYHSRPVAPTRRVALGRLYLPSDPAPGFGGVLLGGVAAHSIGGVDPDELGDLERLTFQVEHGLRVEQPRLRYRFQRDRVGLHCSTHRLHGAGDELWFEFDDEHGTPSQQLLGAVYAVGALPVPVRRRVMAAVRAGIGWTGPVGPELIARLNGHTVGAVRAGLAVGDPVGWALEVLGFDGDGAARDEVQRRYRRLLMEAHPDRGGAARDAAHRIAELAEARRILLG